MKILRWLVPLVWFVCCMSMPVQAQDRGDPNKVPILLYHAIAEDTGPLHVTPARLREHMAYLRQHGYQPVLFGELGKVASVRKPVLITFDDGYENQYTMAYPILRAFGMKATLFVVTGNVGRRGHVTWAQIREMEASGVMNAQSHTVTHPDLTKLSPAERDRELRQSAAELRRRLGHTVPVLAYPYGVYDQATIKAVRQAGYRFAVTGEPGYADIRRAPLTLNRNLITQDTTMDEFRRLLP